MCILEKRIRKRVKKKCGSTSHLPKLWKLYAEIVNEREENLNGGPTRRVEGVAPKRDAAPQ
jgi:hypothetical protein